MAAVPTFGLDGGAPAALCEKRVFGFKVFHGFGEDGKHLHAEGGSGANRSGRDTGANEGGTREDRGADEDGRCDKSHCVIRMDVLELNVSGDGRLVASCLVQMDRRQGYE